ncbi:MAG: hypothetical protein LQ341_003811 [Variospora aurantia]|nr:MAG: hypothetical protein LQ341_003811 [Variospora aurantia]
MASKSPVAVFPSSCTIERPETEHDSVTVQLEWIDPRLKEAVAMCLNMGNSEIQGLKDDFIHCKLGEFVFPHIDDELCCGAGHRAVYFPTSRNYVSPGSPRIPRKGSHGAQPTSECQEATANNRDGKTKNTKEEVVKIPMQRILPQATRSGNENVGRSWFFKIASLVDDLAIDLEYDALDHLSTELTLREFKTSEASTVLRSVNRKLTSCLSRKTLAP